MEKGENFDEIFDLKPIFPEIYSIKPQISDNNERISSPPNIKNSPISWNSSSSNSAASVPTLISFENSDDNTDYRSNNLEMANDYSLTSGILKFSSSAKDDSGSNGEYYHDMNKERVSAATARTPSQALDHVMAERKRRENLSQLFISLSKVVPGLKKLDKASLLEDGINYLKTLQERVRVLEEEEERRSSIDAAAREGSSSYNSESDGPEIQARISDKHVLIKIFCKKEMGLMSRIPCEILEKMHLNVVDMRLMPFGGTALDITILAEMQREFVGTVKDVVDHLHTLF